MKVGTIKNTMNRMIKRLKKGFTLSETLMAVAILAVLFAVGTPALISLKKNLKYRELDDCARQIYLATQNQLTAADSAGKLEQLAAKMMGGNYTTSGDNANTSAWFDKSELGDIILDNSIDTTIAANSYAVRINFATGTVLEVLYSEYPTEGGKGVDLNGNAENYSGDGDENKAARKENYVGQYDSGDIYIDGDPTKGVLDRSKIRYLPLSVEIKDNESGINKETQETVPDGKLRLEISLSELTNKQVKSTLFGRNLLNEFNEQLKSDKISYSFEIKVEELDVNGDPVEGEEKTVIIEPSKSDTTATTEYFDDINTYRYWDISKTHNSEHKYSYSYLSKTVNTNKQTTKAGLSFTFDSLTEDHFKDIVKGITPGADIRITVTATINGTQEGDCGFLSTKASVITNSLFQSVTFDGKTSADSNEISTKSSNSSNTAGDTEEEDDPYEGVTKRQIFISNPRHLQNLNGNTSSTKTDYTSRTSGVNLNAIEGADGEKNEDKDILWTVFQTADIDWGETEQYYKDSDTEKLTIYPFMPINAQFAGETDIYLTSYISLDLAKSSESESTAKNSATEKDYAEVQNLKIEDLVNYAKPNGNDEKSVAGLFGYLAAKDPDEQQILLKNIQLVNLRESVSKVTYAGGLVGYAKDIKIRNCDIEYTGTADKKATEAEKTELKENRIQTMTGTYLGGLVGNLTSTENCVSLIEDCDIRSWKQEIHPNGENAVYGGGLVGNIENYTEISNCTVADTEQEFTVTGTAKGEKYKVIFGGFVGQATKTTVSESCLIASDQTITSRYIAGGFAGFLDTDCALEKCAIKLNDDQETGDTAAANNQSTESGSTEKTAEQTIKGKYAAGFIGQFKDGKKLDEDNKEIVPVKECEISDVVQKINEDTENTDEITFDGAQVDGEFPGLVSGGFIGKLEHSNKEYSVDVTECNLTNVQQTITPKNDGTSAGFIGEITSSFSADKALTTTIDDCHITSDNSDEQSVRGAYAGGFVGKIKNAVTENKNEIKFTGCSIEGIEQEINGNLYVDTREVGSLNYDYDVSNCGGFFGRVQNWKDTCTVTISECEISNVGQTINQFDPDPNQTYQITNTTREEISCGGFAGWSEKNVAFSEDVLTNVGQTITSNTSNGDTPGYIASGFAGEAKTNITFSKCKITLDDTGNANRDKYKQKLTGNIVGGMVGEFVESEAKADNPSMKDCEISNIVQEISAVTNKELSLTDTETDASDCGGFIGSFLNTNIKTTDSAEAQITACKLSHVDQKITVPEQKYDDSDQTVGGFVGNAAYKIKFSEDNIIYTNQVFDAQGATAGGFVGSAEAGVRLNGYAYLNGYIELNKCVLTNDPQNITTKAVTGGFAGSILGDVTVNECKISLDDEGKKATASYKQQLSGIDVGGLAGSVKDYSLLDYVLSYGPQKNKIEITNCEISEVIQEITGVNDTVIDENTAIVADTGCAGGLFGILNNKFDTYKINVDGCKLSNVQQTINFTANQNNVAAQTAGGFAGSVINNVRITDSSVTNTAQTLYSPFTCGGFVGYASGAVTIGDAPDSDGTTNKCTITTNTGKEQTLEGSYVGGFVGYAIATEEDNPCKITYSYISSVKQNLKGTNVGGLIGEYNGIGIEENENETKPIENCEISDLTQEITGVNKHLSSTVNQTTVTEETGNAGGFFGGLENSSLNDALLVDSCKLINVQQTITFTKEDEEHVAAQNIGGFAGLVQDNVKITASSVTNAVQTLTSPFSCGGFVGYASDKITIGDAPDAETGKSNKCTIGIDSSISGYNSATVYGQTLEGTNVGGLIGYLSDTLDESEISYCDVSNINQTMTGVGTTAHNGGLIGSVMACPGDISVSNCNISSVTQTMTGKENGGQIGYIEVDPGTVSVADCDVTNLTQTFAVNAAKGTAGGLLGRMENGGTATVQNCDVRNTKINATTAGDSCSIGGLVGETVFGDINNCKAYIEYTGIDSGEDQVDRSAARCTFYKNYTMQVATQGDWTNIGGLVGKLYCANVSSSSASWPSISVTGNLDSYAGGLVGGIGPRKNHTITNSYADTGLVQLVRDEEDPETIVSEWYSDDSFTAGIVTDKYAGGLVGTQSSESTLTIINSYAMGHIASASVAGGFVGLQTGEDKVNASYCYALVDLNTNPEDGTTGITGEAYGFAKSVAESTDSNASDYRYRYWKQSNLDDASSTYGKSCSYFGAPSDDFFTGSGFEQRETTDVDVTPYGIIETSSDEKFLFMYLGDHYGDWPFTTTIENTFSSSAAEVIIVDEECSLYADIDITLPGEEDDCWGDVYSALYDPDATGIELNVQIQVEELDSTGNVINTVYLRGKNPTVSGKPYDTDPASTEKDVYLLVLSDDENAKVDDSEEEKVNHISTLAKENANPVITFKYTYDPAAKTGGNTFRIYLDQLGTDAAKRFSSIFSDFSENANGSNIRVKATLLAATIGDDFVFDVIEPETEADKTAYPYGLSMGTDIYNSLFYYAKPSGFTPTSTATDAAKAIEKINWQLNYAKAETGIQANLRENAHIYTCRHLQNLDADYSAVTGVTKAAQYATINWSLAKEGTEQLTFNPIHNTELQSYANTVNSTGEETNYNEIRNLIIGEKTVGSGETARTESGLFAELEGTEASTVKLEYIKIVNAKQTGLTADYAGGLVGYAKNVNLTGCQLYMDSAITGFSKFTDYKLNTTGSYAGGLVGSAEGCVFDKCSASWPIIDAPSAVSCGGLIGIATGKVEVEYCYADTGILKDEDSEAEETEESSTESTTEKEKVWDSGISANGTAGGLVGQVGTGASFKNCYSMGYIIGGSPMAGFVGAGDFSAEECYSYVYLNAAAAAENRYGFASGTVTETGKGYKFWKYGNCAQDKTSANAVLSGYFTTLTGAEPDYPAWSAAAWENTTVKKPYSSITTVNFNFMSLTGVQHYGDWWPNNGFKVRVEYVTDDTLSVLLTERAIEGMAYDADLTKIDVPDQEDVSFGYNEGDRVTVTIGETTYLITECGENKAQKVIESTGGTTTYEPSSAMYIEKTEVSGKTVYTLKVAENIIDSDMVVSITPSYYLDYHLLPAGTFEGNEATVSWPYNWADNVTKFKTTTGYKETNIPYGDSRTLYTPTRRPEGEGENKVYYSFGGWYTGYASGNYSGLTESPVFFDKAHNSGKYPSSKTLYARWTTENETCQVDVYDNTDSDDPVYTSWPIKGSEWDSEDEGLYPLSILTNGVLNPNMITVIANGEIQKEDVYYFIEVDENNNVVKLWISEVNYDTAIILGRYVALYDKNDGVLTDGKWDTTKASVETTTTSPKIRSIGGTLVDLSTTPQFLMPKMNHDLIDSSVNSNYDYTYKGWSPDAPLSRENIDNAVNGNDETKSADERTVKVSKYATVFYGNWNPTEYEIKYLYRKTDGTDETLATDKYTVEDYVADGDGWKIDLTRKPEKEGYEFKGWFEKVSEFADDSKKVEKITTFAGDRTFYARFDIVITYAVKVETGSTAKGLVKLNKENADAASSVYETVLDASGLSADAVSGAVAMEAVEGYRFDHWEDKNGTAVGTAGNATFKPTKDTTDRFAPMTYYACFSNMYTVTLHTNGHGTIPTDAKTIIKVDDNTAKIQVPYGSTVKAVLTDAGISVDSLTLSDTSYRFEGWFTDNTTFDDPYYFTEEVKADTDVFAEWTEPCTVHFKKLSTDTTDYATRTVYKGDKITDRPVDPERDGYTFVTWKKDDTEWNFTSDTVQGDMTLVADWSQNPPEKYTVTVHGKNGNTHAYTNIDSGTQFKFWINKDQYSKQILDKDTALSSSSVSVLVDKTAQTLGTMKSNYDSDKVTESSIQTVTTGWYVIEFTKTDKWSGCSNTYVVAVTGIVTDNTDIYLNYGDTYTVTFDLNGMPAEYIAPQTVAKNGIASKPTPDPSAEGYKFKYWSTNKNSTSSSDAYQFTTAVNSNLTLYAIYDTTGTVAFKYDRSIDGPSYDSAFSKTYVETGTVNSSGGYDYTHKDTITNPTWEEGTKTIATFKGWYKNEACTDPATDEGYKQNSSITAHYDTVQWAPSTNEDGSEKAGTVVWLYPKWLVTVNFDLNGGHVKGDTSATTIKEQSGKYGFTLSSVAEVEKSGEVFLGWSTVDQTEDATASWFNVESQPVEGNMTLYAWWEESYYTIRYNGNGNTNTTVTMEDQMIKMVDEDGNGGAYLRDNAFEKTRYTCSDTKTWYTEAGVLGTDKQYFSDQQFVKLDQDYAAYVTKGTVVDLYVNWIGSKYVATFDCNGGKYESKNTFTQEYGLANPLNFYIPTKDGSMFVGWELISVEEGNWDEETTTLFTSGFPESKYGTVTFTAKWTAQPEITVTVSGDELNPADTDLKNKLTATVSITECVKPVTSADYKLNLTVYELNASGNHTGNYFTVTKSITSGADDNSTTVISSTDDIGTKYTGDATEFTILLDSLEEGKHFSNISAGSSIAPGANIEVVCEMVCTDTRSITTYTETESGTAVKSAATVTSTYTVTGSAKTNSLFAYATDAEISADSSISNRIAVAKISNRRHLQNLHPDFSTVSSSVSSAKQYQSIDWSNSIKTTFTPIVNTAFKLYEGNSKTISNLKVNETGNAGLFGTVSGSLTVKNLTIEKGVIDGSNAGGLIGTGESGSTVTVQNVKVNKSNITATGNAGGMIGAAAGSTSIDSSLVTSLADYKVSAGSNAGGLIGLSQNGATIDNSAASERVESSDKAGGLIGSNTAGDLTITNSYSGGHTNDKKYETDSTSKYNIIATDTAGGLVGYAGGGTLTVKQSFNTASVCGSSTAGGIVGELAASDTVMDYVYVLSPVYGTPVNNLADAYESCSQAGFIGKVTGYDSSHKVQNTNCFYLAEVYTGYSYVSDEDVNMATVAYLGGYDPTTVTAPEPLESRVRLAYYQETSNVVQELRVESNVVIKVYPYDDDLSTYDYPYKNWTTAAKESNSASYRTFYGDWQPVLNPPLEPISLTFLYEHPGTRNMTNQSIPVKLKEQSIVRYKDNTVVVPDTPKYAGYQKTTWKLYTYDKSTGVYTPLSTVALTESNGKITIPSEACTQNLCAIMSYEKTDKTGNSCTIFFMYNPDPSEEKAYSEYEDLNQLIVENGTVYKTVSTTEGYYVKEISGWYFADWLRIVDESAQTTEVVDFYYGEDTVSTDMVVYADYSETESFTATVNFMYQYGEDPYDITKLTRISGYESQYRIKATADGKQQTVKVTVPVLTDLPITKIYTRNMSDDDTENTMTPVTITGADLHLNDDGTMSQTLEVNVNAKSTSEFVVVYCVKAESPFVVKYILNNTASDKSYAETPYTFYYTGDQDTDYISTSSSDSLLFYSLKDNDETVPAFQHGTPKGFYPDYESITYKMEGGTYAKEIVNGETCRIVELEYSRRPYTLWYNYNGGTAAKDEEGKDIQYRDLLYGQPMTVPSGTTKSGYVLDGEKPWTLTSKKKTESGEIVITEYNINDPMPLAMVTAKANWTVAKSKFKVVYMLENADDDGYSYFRTYSSGYNKSGELVDFEWTTKDTLNYTKFTETYTISMTEEDTEYFSHFKNNHNTEKDVDVTVLEDGSTVLTVYYKRDTHTIIWYNDRSVLHQVTAKYGQNISDEWPKNDDGTPKVFETEESGHFQCYIGTVTEDRTFYQAKQGNKTADYYFEVLDSEIESVQDDSDVVMLETQGVKRWYRYGWTDKAQGSILSPLIDQNDCYPVTGFTYHAVENRLGDVTVGKYSDGEYNYDGCKFYYTRNDSKIEIVSGHPVNDNTASYTIQYQESLSEFKTDAKRQEIENKLEIDTVNYDFIGWYQDPEMLHSYTFPDTMDVNNIKVYGKWWGKEHTVKLQLDGDAGESFPDGSTYKEIKCYYGETIESIISLPEYEPQRDNYTFECWTKQKTGGEKFSASEPITEDITLYPYSWIADTHTEYREVLVQYIGYHQVTDPVTQTTSTEEVALGTKTIKAYIDDTIRITAESYAGYTARILGMDYVVGSEKDQTVTIYYDETTKWTYTLKYWLSYESVEALSSLDSATLEKIEDAMGGSFSADKQSFLISTESIETENQYETVEAALPEELRDYLITGYRFSYKESATATERTVYPENPQSVASIWSPAGVEPAVADVWLEFFIEPDYDHLTIDDQNVLYNGADQNETMMPNKSYTPASGKGSLISAVESSVFCQTIGGLEAKDVGQYAIKGYYTIKLTPTSGTPVCFLLAVANEDEELNLKIRQRTYKFVSMSDNAVYSDETLLECQKLYIEGDLIDPAWEGVTITFDSLTNDTDGSMNGHFFPEGEGFNVYSSVEAFRKSVGTMKNIFKVTEKDGTDKENYTITSEYGTLTVGYWKYDAEIVLIDGETKTVLREYSHANNKAIAVLSEDSAYVSYSALADGDSELESYELQDEPSYETFARTYITTTTEETNTTSYTETSRVTGTGDSVEIRPSTETVTAVKFYVVPMTNEVTEENVMNMSLMMMSAAPVSEETEEGTETESEAEESEEETGETETEKFVEEVETEEPAGQTETEASGETEITGTEESEEVTEGTEEAESAGESEGTEEPAVGETGEEAESEGEQTVEHEESTEPAESEKSESAEETETTETEESEKVTEESGSAEEPEQPVEETEQIEDPESEETVAEGPAIEEPELTEEEFARIAEEEAAKAEEEARIAAEEAEKAAAEAEEAARIAEEEAAAAEAEAEKAAAEAEEAARIAEEEALAAEEEVAADQAQLELIEQQLSQVTLSKCTLADAGILQQLYGNNQSIIDSLVQQDAYTAEFWSVLRNPDETEPLKVPYGGAIYLKLENFDEQYSVEWIELPFQINPVAFGSTRYLQVIPLMPEGTGDFTLYTLVNVGTTFTNTLLPVVESSIEVTAG